VNKKSTDRFFAPVGATPSSPDRPIGNDQLWQLIALTSDFYWRENARNRCVQLYANRSVESAHPLRIQLPGLTLRQAGASPMTTADRKRYLEARRQRRPFHQLVFRLGSGDNEALLSISGTPQIDDRERFLGYHCCATDITRQQQNNTHLERFRAAIDTSTDMIYLVDPASLKFVDVNRTAVDASGLSREELLQRGPAETLDMDPEELRVRYTSLIQEGHSSRYIREVAGRDGQPIHVEIYSRAACIDGKWIIIGISRDISHRRRTEERTRRLQQMFSALSETNAAILRAESVQSLYERVCDAAIHGGRFSIAAILTPDESGTLLARARSGATTQNLPRPSISIRPDVSGGEGISGEAWRTGEPSISNDFLNDPRLTRWADYAREYGLRSAAAFPIFQRRRLVALLLFYATELNTFDEEITRLLISMANNVSYALDSFASDEERRRAEQQIRESEARFRSLTGLSSDFYWEQDEKLQFTRYEGKVVGEANRCAIRRLLGERLFDQPDLQPHDGDWTTLKALQEKRQTFRDVGFAFVNEEGVTYHFSLSGEPIFDDNGGFLGYRGISRDITEKQEIADQMHYLATHDSLTDLPNRVMFMELLEQSIRVARRYPEHSFAVLFIDLDRFKNVNDTHGHHTGDLLLREVADRLRQPVRDSDVIARLSGDEFVILLHQITDPAEAERVAAKLLEVLETPLRIEDHTCEVSASIGITLYGPDSVDADTLMQRADSAMYEAKNEGRNRIRLYPARPHRRGASARDSGER